MSKIFDILMMENFQKLMIDIKRLRFNQIVSSENTEQHT